MVSSAFAAGIEEPVIVLLSPNPRESSDEVSELVDEEKPKSCATPISENSGHHLGAKAQHNYRSGGTAEAVPFQGD